MNTATLENEQAAFFAQLRADPGYGGLFGKPTLKEGSSGKAVTDLQNQLKSFGYKVLSPSGSFDSDTTYALQEFQEVSGVPVTGVTDKATWDAIDALEKTNKPAKPSAVGVLTSVFDTTTAVIGAVTGKKKGKKGTDLAMTTVPEPAGTNWLLIGGLVFGAVVVIGGVGYVLTRKT
jgi:peptidoglycan hydrolase-like protein with peptidoglycan-binding domain